MQVNIQVKHDLRRIEQIDSTLHNNEDTQHVIQQLKEAREHESDQHYEDHSQDGFITLKHACSLTSLLGFMNY